MWLCRCECGRKSIVRGSLLRMGKTKSCGCLNRFPSGVGNMRRVIRTYKNDAKKRGIEYNLTEKQFAKITQKNCYYCGAKPNNVTNNNVNSGEYIYNGIDRIDNSKGYTIDNVVPCCKTCNSAKGTLTTKEFKEWVVKIYNNLII